MLKIDMASLKRRSARTTERIDVVTITDEEVKMPDEDLRRPVFLPGSIAPKEKGPRKRPHSSQDVREAVRTFVSLLVATANTLGLNIAYLPLGETEDSNWVSLLMSKFKKIKALRCWWSGKFGSSERYRHLPWYSSRRGQKANVDEIDLMMASRAKQGEPILKEELQRVGLDRKSYKLQIGVNLIDLLIFALKFGAWKQLDQFIERLRREAAEVWEKTDGKACFVIEIPTLTILANFTRFRFMRRLHDRLMNWYLESLIKLVGALPEGAEWGFHFCYGRLGGKALGDWLRWLLYKPYATVWMINFIFAGLAEKGFVPNFAHIPFKFGSRPPSTNADDYMDYLEANIDPRTTVYGGYVTADLDDEELAGIGGLLDWIFNRLTGYGPTCGWGSTPYKKMKADMEAMRRTQTP